MGVEQKNLFHRCYLIADGIGQTNFLVSMIGNKKRLPDDSLFPQHFIDRKERISSFDSLLSALYLLNFLRIEHCPALQQVSPNHFTILDLEIDAGADAF